MSWVLRLHEKRSESAITLAQLTPEGVGSESGPVNENSTYWWHLQAQVENPFNVELRIDGESLPRDMASDGEFWFRWEVGFNAGFVDLDLRNVAPRTQALRLTIDPDRRKILRADYRRMVRDILEDSRSLASTAGFKIPAARGSDPLPIATLEFILENADRVQYLVESLNELHRRRLRPETVRSDLGRTRGLTSSQWNDGLRNGKALSPSVEARLPNRVRGLVARSGGRLPLEITERRPTRDSALREHREILGLLTEISRLLRRARQGQLSLPLAARNAVLVGACTRLDNRIQRLQMLAVFAGLQPERASWKPSRLYAEVQPYAALYRLHRDLKAGLSALEGDFHSIPLRQTHRLYETWVALRLAAAARILDPQLNGRTLFKDVDEANKLTLRMDATALEFAGNVLRFKPVYREAWLVKGGIGSNSSPMIPDIVIELAPPTSGDPRTVLILDAKYRVDSQLNDALSSIHMYRDALRDISMQSEGRRIVSGGLIIVPKQLGSSDGVNWRTEKTPTVLFRRSYQDQFKIGALVLRPGISSQRVAAMLQGLLVQFGCAGEDPGANRLPAH